MICPQTKLISSGYNTQTKTKLFALELDTIHSSCVKDFPYKDDLLHKNTCYAGNSGSGIPFDKRFQRYLDRDTAVDA